MPDSERLASARGRASAEAYVLLELREARSAGHNVFAFQSNGRYTIRSIANEPLLPAGSLMTGRTTRRSVTFSHPFSLSELDGTQPAGTYRIQTLDVALDSLSYLAYRRVVDDRATFRRRSWLKEACDRY